MLHQCSDFGIASGMQLIKNYLYSLSHSTAAFKLVHHSRWMTFTQALEYLHEILVIVIIFPLNKAHNIYVNPVWNNGKAISKHADWRGDRETIL